MIAMLFLLRDFVEILFHLDVSKQEWLGLGAERSVPGVAWDVFALGLVEHDCVWRLLGNEVKIKLRVLFLKMLKFYEYLSIEIMVFD